VKGLQTAAGNRAYTDAFGPGISTSHSISPGSILIPIFLVASETGAAAQRLLELGVVIIGKTKTAQYASGESYNDNWIEVRKFNLYKRRPR
jgi:hypothetical protein